jgi:hypothetical protein
MVTWAGKKKDTDLWPQKGTRNTKDLLVVVFKFLRFLCIFAAKIGGNR